MEVPETSGGMDATLESEENPPSVILLEDIKDSADDRREVLTTRLLCKRHKWRLSPLCGFMSIFLIAEH